MKKIVVFSGAGLSAESGIQTFRASDGLWEQHKITDVATPEAWSRNPKLVLDFYAARFLKIQECEPNPAHEALAKLQLHYEVINITQNIDTLLERAGCNIVWHLHGRIDTQKCERHYDIFGFRDSYYACDFKSEISTPIAINDQCPKCKSKLRPDVVWFGESVDMRQSYLEELINSATVFIGVGTSAQVYPAAGLLTLFQDTPRKYFIDPNPFDSALNGFEVIKESATIGLPKLVNNLIETQ